MYLYALSILWPIVKKKKKLTAYVLMSLLALIALSVAFNKWRGFFYDNIQLYNVKNVWIGIGVFIVLALINVVVYGISSYYTRFLEFSIRESLYHTLCDKIMGSDVPNKDQRLQEDTLRFGRTILALIKAVVDSVVRLPVFLIVLWSVAPFWMVIVSVVYAVIGTLGSRKVAARLVDLEYIQEAKEATLRRNIIKAVEETTAFPTLDEIKENWTALAVRNKLLSYYTSFYGQIAVIFPYVMLLPMYLHHAIMLGVLFQTSSAIEQVLSSLSVFVDSRDLVVDLQMITKRIKELDKKA
jgi:ABC-type uncharacterized transport system fused permease/ATPase subunit